MDVRIPTFLHPLALQIEVELSFNSFLYMFFQWKIWRSILTYEIEQSFCRQYLRFEGKITENIWMDYGETLYERIIYHAMHVRVT